MASKDPIKIAGEPQSSLEEGGGFRAIVLTSTDGGRTWDKSAEFGNYPSAQAAREAASEVADRTNNDDGPE